MSRHTAMGTAPGRGGRAAVAPDSEDRASTEAAGRPFGLERWRLTDAIQYARLLAIELCDVGLPDEADVVHRIRLRLMARRQGMAYIGPTGRLEKP